MHIKKIIIGLLVLSTTAFAAAKIQNADIKTNAAIDATKLIDGSVTNTELGYINTLTSNAQTQLNAKLDTSAFSDTAVTSKLLTGYVSGAGTVAATDTILQAIQKLNGNIAGAGGLNQLTGDVTAGPGTGSQVATIANLAVTTGKINDLAVTTGKINDLAVTTGKIDDLAVTNGKIANSTIDLTTKVTGVLPNANTTAASTNTASAIVARDGSGNFAAGTVTAALSGNATTATALAANPTDCSANNYATAIDASGNLTCGQVSASAGITGTLPVANGGTGQTSYVNGELLIGNTTGNTLTKATLTAGTGISITNGAGSITIATTGGGGGTTVYSADIASGNGNVSNEHPSGWITGNCAQSAGSRTCTVTGFTNAPACWCAATSGSDRFCSISGAPTNTTVVFETVVNGASDANSALTVFCKATD